MCGFKSFHILVEPQTRTGCGWVGGVESCLSCTESPASQSVMYVYVSSLFTADILTCDRRESSVIILKRKQPETLFTPVFFPAVPSQNIFCEKGCVMSVKLTFFSFKKITSGFMMSVITCLCFNSWSHDVASFFLL